MDSSDGSAYVSRSVPAALIAVGLVIGGWLLGSHIKATRLGDGYVSVKGLVERQVKSEQAIWSIGFKQAGGDLASVYTRIESDGRIVLEF